MRKTVKGLISLFICTVLILTSLGVGVLAEGDFTVSAATDKTEVKTGDNVTLTISFENNAGIKSFDMNIEYDNTKLEYVEAQTTTGSSNDTIGKKGGSKVNLTIENYSGNGSVAWAKFKVKDGVEGDAEFKLGQPSVSNEAGTVKAVCNSPKKISITKKTEYTVSLNKETLALNVGMSDTLTATVTPDGGAVVWSSDNEAVAKVDGGKVTAVGEGEANITASVGDKNAKCKVTVTAKTSGITVDAELEVKVGESKKINVTGATGTVAFASSDDKVASVDENGNVTGVAAGNVEITVKCGDFEAKCKVKVAAASVALKNIRLDYSTVTLESGGRQNLKVVAEPAGATVDESKLKWTSSNDKVATVSDTGRVRAKSGVSGTATIKVTYGDYSAECVVTVTYIPAVDIKLEKDTFELEENETATIKATLSPIDTNDALEFSSSDDTIASVNATTGKITAKKAGQVTITVKAGKITKQCTVNVSKPDDIPNLEGVEISNESITLTVGEQFKLTYSTLPAVIEEMQVAARWISGDDSIAEVDSNGTVTAKKAGMTTVRVALGNKYADCTVTVKAAATTEPEQTGAPVTDIIPGTDSSTAADSQPIAATDLSGGNGIFKVILVAIIILVAMFIALTVLYFVQKRRAADYEDDDDDYYDDDDDDDEL